MIHSELCQRLKTDHTDKWYIHKPESVQENETCNILRNIGIQTAHSVLASRSHLAFITKKKTTTCHLVDFVVPADHKPKMKENEERDKYLDLVGELKKLLNMKMTVIPIIVSMLGSVPKGLNKKHGIGNQRKNRDHGDYTIVEID